MADDINITQGDGGKVIAADDVSGKMFQRVKLVHGADGSNDGDVALLNPLPVKIASVSAGKLKKSYTVAEEVTCTNANTDYPCSTAMVSGDLYVTVFCLYACIVAMGVATSSTNGVYVGAGIPTTFAVTVTGTAADDKPHVQSATAGAVVRFTYTRD